MPEPVEVTVSGLCRRIRELEPAPSAEAAGGALFGALFHATAAALFDPDHPAHWEQILDDEADRVSRLAAELYDRALGPELVRHRALLEGAGARVLGVWNATRAFARWFCRLVEVAVSSGALRYDAARETWEGAEGLFQSEVELAAWFREPGWKRTVLVSGRADNLVRAGANKCCVVEFKLGDGGDSAALLQACLYRLLLDTGEAGAGRTSVALVRFLPSGEQREIVISAERAESVRPQLMDLIAAEAEAALHPAPPRPAAGAVPGWPKPPGEEEEETARQLLDAFTEFGARVRLTGPALVGPAFVRYFVEPARGVPARRVLKQALNLQARLRLPHAPLIDVVDGRIAVDVQRATREDVPFEHVRGALPPPDPGAGNSRVLVGVDLAGQAVFADFSAPENTHALVAGAAGGGKTEWLRSALASLLLANTPETLRLALVDPKGNAFGDLARSPFLWKPGPLLQASGQDALALFEELGEEMDRRFRLFAVSGADDLQAHARKAGAPLARIFCVCDELADLLLAGRGLRQAIESAVNRLGQKARAAGIHLIFATQRPSRDVVSGILKANLPCRVALRVTEALESRIILDAGGAENLLGRGDLLFLSAARRLRLQSPYLDERARREIFAGAAATAG